MKKQLQKFLPLAICAVALGACTQKHAVVVNAPAWGNDTIVRISHIWGADREVLDTLVAVNGVVEFDLANPTDTLDFVLCAIKDVEQSKGRRPSFPGHRVIM